MMCWVCVSVDCGPSTMVMVLNALQLDPGRIWKVCVVVCIDMLPPPASCYFILHCLGDVQKPWRWYAEEMLSSCDPRRLAEWETLVCVAAREASTATYLHTPVSLLYKCLLIDVGVHCLKVVRGLVEMSRDRAIMVISFAHYLCMPCSCRVCRSRSLRSSPSAMEHTYRRLEATRVASGCYAQAY